MSTHMFVQVGYSGRQCSKCGEDYYRRRRLCIKCPSEEAVQFNWIILYLFIYSLDFAIMFFNLEVAQGIVDLVLTLQMFREIGMMGANFLPESLMEYYSALGIFTFDIEFTKPGCNGSSSDFDAVFFANLLLVIYAVAPVLVILGGIIVLCRLKHWAAKELETKVRLVYCSVTWLMLAAMVLSGRCMEAVFCLPDEAGTRDNFSQCLHATLVTTCF